jgi:hypothetical protein
VHYLDRPHAVAKLNRLRGPGETFSDVTIALTSKAGPAVLSECDPHHTSFASCGLIVE